MIHIVSVEYGELRWCEEMMEAIELCMESAVDTRVRLVDLLQEVNEIHEDIVWNRDTEDGIREWLTLADELFHTIGEMFETEGNHLEVLNWVYSVYERLEAMGVDLQLWMSNDTGLESRLVRLSFWLYSETENEHFLLRNMRGIRSLMRDFDVRLDHLMAAN